MKKVILVALIMVLCMGMAVLPLVSAAEGDAGAATSAATTTTANSLEVSQSSDLAAQLGVLLGDGEGVTDKYLGKSTTRIQGAILTLRLLGKEKEAIAFTGTDNFADASSVGKSIQPVLAYLKMHPDLGWSGTGGGKFSPNAAITAQQVYKVMLEALSYRTGTDFAFAGTVDFAASKGLWRAASAAPFTNRDLAVALMETLQAVTKDGTKSLVNVLAESNIVAADKAVLLGGNRIDLHKTADGSVYFTDGNGRSLYLFAKDMSDLNTCKGDCLVNWPIFASDRLLLADGLDAKDFSSFIRDDNTKQLTFQGWPLYEFKGDTKAGDTNGEGKGGVWFLIKKPFYTVTLGNNATLGSYLVDTHGMTLYYFDKDPMGSSVCKDQCLVNWPAFHADSVQVPSGLKASDFGEITRADGAKQTTFKGYPLYHWNKDAKRGDTTGQNLNNVWFVVDPAKFAGTTTGNAAPAKVTVEMKNYSFSTPTLTVKAGTTVEFVNQDDDKHSVVFVDGSFKSDLISKGQTITVKLDKPGTYDYYCEPHKDHMKGVITVQ